MKHEHEIYYPYLGKIPTLKRYIQPNSLYYSNKSRSLLLYNKSAEAKSKGHEIPEVWTDKHVLRYEIRYRRRLHKQLKVTEVRARTMYEEKFYIKLTDRCVSDIISIHKNAEINLDTENMKKQKE